MQRYALPEELGPSVVYLASDGFGFRDRRGAGDRRWLHAVLNGCEATQFHVVAASTDPSIGRGI